MLRTVAIVLITLLLAFTAYQAVDNGANLDRKAAHRDAQMEQLLETCSK